MPTYLQADRAMAVTTPLGQDALLLVGVTGHEGLSQLFSFQLDLLAERRTEVAFDKLLGQKISVRLSLAELYDERYSDSGDAQKKIVEFAEGVHNESPLHASLMLYRARALRKLGLLEAAQETLTEALRRKKDYPPDLLIALRYERALVYEATGKDKQARSEFEKLYAEAPTFADVAARVGL